MAAMCYVLLGAFVVLKSFAVKCPFGFRCRMLPFIIPLVVAAAILA
jgi:hypothetical protein